VFIADVSTSMPERRGRPTSGSIASLMGGRLILPLTSKPGFMGSASVPIERRDVSGGVGGDGSADERPEAGGCGQSGGGGTPPGISGDIGDAGGRNGTEDPDVSS
jgi:hypothetical protein